MTNVVHVFQAAAGDDDIKLAWAVYRAANMCQAECWNQPASMIDFGEQLTRKEKLFFLRCWKFHVEGGGFMRIFGGYETLFANVCDKNSDALAFSQEMQARFSDAGLLPVVLEAYDAAKIRAVELEGELATITNGRELWQEMVKDLDGARGKRKKSPDFKALARELVDNLVDCGSLDEGSEDQYLAFAEDACRKAFTGGV